MKIMVGSVCIGCEYIPIQSMIKNKTTDINLTLKKISLLQHAGCDIIRITVPDKESAHALSSITRDSVLPVVGDIHFDHKLAIMAVQAGVKKIRINPGNIGGEKNVREIIACCKEYGVPVRIGINAGSLPEEMHHLPPVTAMIETCKKELSYFEKYDFNDVVLSFKSSRVTDFIEVNRKAKELFPFPLHIGVTEAGDLQDGVIKNAVGIGTLLAEGIGDTIRVSLSAPEIDEVIAGRKILEALKKRVPQIEVISCPTCGRTEIDISRVVENLKKQIEGVVLKHPLKIAVMGCVVNGPGEAKDADFGVACGKNSSLLFREGKKIKNINNSRILDELILMVSTYEK